MVKQPQGRLGYWVDGKLEHMPKICPPAAKREEEKKSRPERKYVRMLKRREESKKKNLTIEDKKDNVRKSTRIERLKNATKTGYFSAVMDQFRNIFFTLHCNFEGLIQHIFIPDIEERTALYYACHTGQAVIVEFFLSLYLLSSLSLVNSARLFTQGDVRYTFFEWFKKIGVAHLNLKTKFREMDYSVCILNALNDNIRQILRKKRVSLPEAVNFVKNLILQKLPENLKSWGALKNMIFDRIKLFETRAKSHRKKCAISKPSLVYDDDTYCGELSYEDYDNDDDEEYNNAHGNPDDSYQYKNECVVGSFIGSDKNNQSRIINFDDNNKMEKIPSSGFVHDTGSVDEVQGNDDESFNFVCAADADIENFQSVESVFEFKNDANRNVHLNECNDEDIHDCTHDLESAVTKSTDWDILEEYEDDNFVPSLSDQNDDGMSDFSFVEDTRKSWDIVSDVQSVQSLNSCMSMCSLQIDPKSSVNGEHPFSYKDMLLQGKKPFRNKGKDSENAKSVKAKPDKIIYTVAEDKDEEMYDENRKDSLYDAYWERDGYKGCRSNKAFRKSTKIIVLK